MPENERRYKILFAVGLMAILFGVLAVSLAQTAQDTANINNVFEVVVNNTDLGCGLGTCERHPNTTYLANDSPIQVYLIMHIVGTGGPEMFFMGSSVNGTEILNTSRDRTISNNLHEHFPQSFTVPKGANYSVRNSSNAFSVEWREYPILSGKNGTLSVNQTFITNGSSFNQSYEDRINFLNNTKVNKSGDISTGIQFFNAGDNTTYLNVSHDSVLLGNMTLFSADNSTTFYDLFKINRSFGGQTAMAITNKNTTGNLSMSEYRVESDTYDSDGSHGGFAIVNSNFNDGSGILPHEVMLVSSTGTKGVQIRAVDGNSAYVRTMVNNGVNIVEVSRFNQTEESMFNRSVFIGQGSTGGKASALTNIRFYDAGLVNLEALIFANSAAFTFQSTTTRNLTLSNDAGKGLKILNSTDGNANKVMFTDSTYAGSGNAYACFNKDGVLFRSATACV